MGLGVVVTTQRGSEAEPEREGEVVPSIARVLPRCELVAPCGVELRASELIGFVAGEEKACRAVGPGELLLGGLVFRHGPRGTDAEDPGLSLDHGVPDLCGSAGNEGYSAGSAGLDLRADPLGTGACLAEAPAGQEYPRYPESAGRLLILPSNERPAVVKTCPFVFRHALSDSADGIETDSVRRHRVEACCE